MTIGQKLHDLRIHKQQNNSLEKHLRMEVFPCPETATNRLN